MLGNCRWQHLAFVLPTVLHVAGTGRLKARENTIALLGVDEAVFDDGSNIRVGERELLEPLVLEQDVANDAAKEGDVSA